MLKNINVSVSPHIRTKDTTSRIMLDVCIALLFPLGAGVYAFGISALYVILVSVISCVLSEYIYQKLMRKPNVKFSRQKTSIGDLSAVVTGLILAVNLPSTVPLWVPAIGGVFAIVVVKQLFGGLGQNFMNPALAARCFLLISLAGIMTKFPTEVNHFFPVADAVSTATPMGMLKLGETTDWFNMVFNTHSGCIGEASALAVLIGALYMVIRKVIDVKIPLVYISSAVVFFIIIQLIKGTEDVLTVNYLVTQICGGGLLVGAFFMATDYVTCPITPLGKTIYALILGFMTVIIRVVSPNVEGVSLAIIIGNMISPLIEKYTVPKAFGLKREKGGKTA